MTYEEEHYRKLGLKEKLSYFMDFHSSYGYTENRHRLLMLEGFLNKKNVNLEDKIKAVIHTLAVIYDESPQEYTREYAIQWIEQAQTRM